MQDTITIQTIPVGPIETNCYILSLAESHDVVLIDPGDEDDKIISAVGDRRVAAVLLTHGHYDHTGALKSFSDKPIYIHRDDAPMLKSPALYRITPSDLPARPDATDFVEDGDRLNLAGLVIDVIRTPGHTPGGVCYRLGQHIFTGDTLFADGYGRTDLPGGSSFQLRQSLRKLFALKGFRAYPGHGDSTVIR